jgi:hypothetical protein
LCLLPKAFLAADDDRAAKPGVANLFFALMLEALDRHGLEMFSIYVGAKVGPDGPSCDSNLKVKSFSGRRNVGQNCGKRGAAVPPAAKLGRHSFSEGQ